MKKALRLLLLAILFLLVGYLLGSKVPIRLFNSIDHSAKVSNWDVFYYLVSLFGVIGTFIAVIVALWKEDILRRLRKVKLKIAIQGLELSYSNSESRYYGMIIVSNPSKYLASNCKITIKSLRYGRFEDEVETIHFGGTHVVKWNYDDCRNIVPGGQQSLSLFCIKQSGDDTTPQENSGDPVIDFWGVSPLPAEQRSNGCWIVDYCVTYNNDTILQDFSIQIQWNGKWNSKKKEFEKVFKFKKL